MSDIFTDSAGITARMTPIEQVRPGDEITEGWKPWPVVSSVEIDGEYARMIFGPSHVGQWHPFGTRVPVVRSWPGPLMSEPRPNERLIEIRNRAGILKRKPSSNREVGFYLRDVPYLLELLDSAVKDAVAVREKMMHNAANLDFAIQQRAAAEAELETLKAEITHAIEELWRIDKNEAVEAHNNRARRQEKQIAFELRIRLAAALSSDGDKTVLTSNPPSGPARWGGD